MHYQNKKCPAVISYSLYGKHQECRKWYSVAISLILLEDKTHPLCSLLLSASVVLKSSRTATAKYTFTGKKCSQL